MITVRGESARRPTEPTVDDSTLKSGVGAVTHGAVDVGAATHELGVAVGGLQRVVARVTGEVVDAEPAADVVIAGAAGEAERQPRRIGEGDAVALAGEEIGAVAAHQSDVGRGEGHVVVLVGAEADRRNRAQAIERPDADHVVAGRAEDAQVTRLAAQRQLDLGVAVGLG